LTGLEFDVEKVPERADRRESREQLAPKIHPGNGAGTDEDDEGEHPQQQEEEESLSAVRF